MARPCYESEVRDKVDPKITKAFLGRAKELLLSGKSADIEGVVSKMAEETGRQKGTILKILTEDPQIKPIMRQMWTQRANARLIREAAKRMVEDADKNKLSSGFGAAWDATRKSLTIGHGGVFPFTHMRESLLVNGERRIFADTFRKAYSYRSAEKGKARWEADMTAMKLDPQFNWWEKRGLKIGDSAKPVGIMSNKIQGWGLRGFDAIKQARLALVKQKWSELAPEQRTKKMAELVADQVNHATGDVTIDSPKVNKWLGRLMFAPKLYWARKMAAVEPFMHLYKGGRMTMEERAATNMAFQRWGQIVAWNAGLVSANAAFNKYVIGNDNVNMTDPSKADWMRMKVGNTSVPISPVFEAIKLPIRLLYTMTAKPQKEMRGEKPTDSATDIIKRELTNVQHPSISLAEELATGYDTFSGRRTAIGGIRQWTGNGTDKETKPRETLLEQVAGHGPLPIGGAVHEFYSAMRDNGMSASQSTMWLRGLAAAATSGVLGIHTSDYQKGPDYKHMSKEKRNREEQDNAKFRAY